MGIYDRTYMRTSETGQSYAGTRAGPLGNRESLVSWLVSRLDTPSFGAAHGLSLALMMCSASWLFLVNAIENYDMASQMQHKFVFDGDSWGGRNWYTVVSHCFLCTTFVKGALMVLGCYAFATLAESRLGTGITLALAALTCVSGAVGHATINSIRGTLWQDELAQLIPSLGNEVSSILGHASDLLGGQDSRFSGPAGAIYGLMPAALLLRNRAVPQTHIWVFAAVFLVVDLFDVVSFENETTSYAARAGGFLCGAVFLSVMGIWQFCAKRVSNVGRLRS